MVKKKPEVVWSDKASRSLKKVYQYIKKDSYSNAEKVRSGIVKIVDSLPDNPEKFPRDKFKKQNPGNYRAFEKYSYRIAYLYTEKEIQVLSLRHVKQEPKEY